LQRFRVYHARIVNSRFVTCKILEPAFDSRRLVANGVVARIMQSQALVKQL
jgi:hypothetical protein